mgnify:CR=1 FL=1
MKILFLNTNIGYGGASKMMVWVANQCAEQGHDVFFLTYRNKDVLQKLNVRIKLVQETLEEEKGKVKFIATVMWLHKFIKANYFDLGVAFLSPSILRMAIAAKGTKMKVVFSQRGDPYHRRISHNLKMKVVGLLNRWAFNQADGYVFQTQMAQAYYSKVIQRRSEVIPNPIWATARTRRSKGDVRKSFVAIGRLDLKQKRQDLMIEAFNLISYKYPDFKLEIYGDGEDEVKVKELVASNPNIQLMGKTNNTAAAIRNAWAAVLASDFEGIPNALLEAMSLGVPSISTDCSPGGAAMLIRNKENGLLVPRGDSIALAGAMEYTILHHEETEMIGARGMEVNELYSENTIRKEWMDFLAMVYYGKNNSR